MHKKESLWKIYELYKNMTQKWTNSYFLQQQTLKIVNLKLQLVMVHKIVSKFWIKNNPCSLNNNYSVLLAILLIGFWWLRSMEIEWMDESILDHVNHFMHHRLILFNFLIRIVFNYFEKLSLCKPLQIKMRSTACVKPLAVRNGKQVYGRVLTWDSTACCVWILLIFLPREETTMDDGALTPPFSDQLLWFTILQYHSSAFYLTEVHGLFV